jgi:hypothetical protein
MTKENLQLSTQTVHAADALNNLPVRDVAAPLHVSTTFRYPDLGSLSKEALEGEVCLIFSEDGGSGHY